MVLCYETCHRLCAVNVSDYLGTEGVFSDAICWSKKKMMIMMLVKVRVLLSKVGNEGIGRQ